MNSILMHHPHSSLSLQSSMQRQRPTHNPSKNLSEKELQCLYNLLGHECVTLATAVAQILHGSDHVWQKQACGVLCYVKDYTKRVYCFRLYDLRSKQSIFEEITYASVVLEKVLDLFYTFDGTKCKIGINFHDQTEAISFCRDFNEKQADRQKKMTTHPLTNTSTSTLINGFKAPTINVIKTSLLSSIPNKPSKSKSRKHETKKNQPLVISEPILPSFQHVIHVAHNDSFLTDKTKKQLFDEVLASMHISPEEEIFIRRTVRNTDDGLEKLFTKSIHDENTPQQQTLDRPPVPPPRIPNTQKQQRLDHPPDIPPRTRNIPKRVPYQEISSPSTTFHPQLQKIDNTPIVPKQSKAPPVAPKPPHRLPNNIQSSTKTKHAPSPPTQTNSSQNPDALPPPPPLPTDFFQPKTNPDVPPPPPPLEQIKTESPTSSSSSEHSSLLAQICNFNTEQLKPTLQQPIPAMKLSEDKSNLEAHSTLEENIRALLDKRRIEIMGRESDNEDNANDSNDDEWDA